MILIFYKNGNQVKFKADLMLKLNKILQKAELEAKVWFGQIKYTSSKSILVFLIKKADTTLLISPRLYLLNQIAKLFDHVVIEIKILK